MAPGPEAEDTGEPDFPDLVDLGAGIEPARTTVVVLTPVRSAHALAALCALQGVVVDALPTDHGAIAATVVEQDPFDVDPAELLSGIPAAAESLGAQLSIVSRAGVVLLTARVADERGELTGQIRARRFAGGKAAGDLAPGLALAAVDDVVERLLLGRVTPADLPGRVNSGDLPTPKPRRWFGRRQRPVPGERDGPSE